MFLADRYLQEGCYFYLLSCCYYKKTGVEASYTVQVMAQSVLNLERQLHNCMSV